MKGTHLLKRALTKDLCAGVCKCLQSRILGTVGVSNNHPQVIELFLKHRVHQQVMISRHENSMLTFSLFFQGMAFFLKESSIFRAVLPKSDLKIKKEVKALETAHPQGVPAQLPQASRYTGHLVSLSSSAGPFSKPVDIITFTSNFVPVCKIVCVL